MKGNSLMAMMALMPIIVSCGPGPLESFGAPKTKSRLGIIASCTTKSQAESIANEYGGKFRVISAKKKIIEF